MARLFVAIDFPDEIKTALQQCQPLQQPGLRNTRRNQLHLTLHFLGESSVDIIQTFLKAHAKLSLPPINVDQLSLYSSVLTPSGPEYKLETPDKMIDTK